jgi:hypothetical protein
MKLLRSIFDDKLTIAAGVILLVIIVLTIFNNYSGMPTRYPLFGVLDYSLVPILFILGGVIFLVAIYKNFRQ